MPPMSATPCATASTSPATPSSSRAWPRSAPTNSKPWRSPSSRCWERKLYAMPGEIDLPIPDPGSLTRGRFTYFPVVPGRLEFAIEVRAAILRDRPEVVALELPATLQPAWMRAVSRLPEISVIFYPDENADDDRSVYVPIRSEEHTSELQSLRHLVCRLL